MTETSDFGSEDSIAISSLNSVSDDSTENTSITSNEANTDTETNSKNVNKIHIDKPLFWVVVISLVISVIIIIILLCVIFSLAYLLYSNEGKESVDLTESTQIQRYSFVHSKNGVASFSGIATTTDNNINYLSGNGSHTLLLQEIEYNTLDQEYDDGSPEIKLFQVKIDLLCCLYYEVRRAGGYDLCHEVWEDVLINFPAKTAHDAEMYVVGEFQNTRHLYGKRCPKREILTIKITGSEEVDPKYFCAGQCEPNTYENFVSKNPELVIFIRRFYIEIKGVREAEVTPAFIEEKSRFTYDQLMSDCGKKKLEGGTNENTKSDTREGILEEFRDQVLTDYCMDAVTAKSTSLGFEFENICRADVVNVECKMRREIVSSGYGIGY